MEQLQTQEPLAIFTANGARGLSVGLSREEFGYQMKPHAEADPAEFEIVHYDDRGNPVGLKPVKFGELGRYDAYDERIVDCLRKHKGNQDNGGNLFMEVPQEVLRQGRELAGGVTAMPPEGGQTDADRELLFSLDRWASARSIPPNSLPKARESFHAAVLRFRVSGVKAHGIIAEEEHTDEGRGNSQ